jgi:hypothetical protein
VNNPKGVVGISAYRGAKTPGFTDEGFSRQAIDQNILVYRGNADNTLPTPRELHLSTFTVQIVFPVTKNKFVALFSEVSFMLTQRWKTAFANNFAGVSALNRPEALFDHVEEILNERMLTIT